MPLETSPESPVPVRTVLQLVGGWIGKLGRVWVEGQIAECTKRGSMVYLTLRDPVAAVSTRVTCSRAVYEMTDPQVGARVVIHAKPDFNASKGSFALAALEVRAVGLGELLARLERLRKELAAEGLFAPERKRPLPFLPHVIGLICGRDSAAERDVLHNAARRWPAVQFRVEQVPVQGVYATTEVMTALRHLDADPEVDVIIIARGGGSVEDLLPFSDEALIRAVSACRTPVVSAIGHEQDTPLLDYVADLRASTPTDAAKRVVPDVTEQMALITQLRDRGKRAVRGWLDREQSWLASMTSRPALADPVREIERQDEYIGMMLHRTRTCLDTRLARATDDITHTRARLLALSPAATLKRGYAIVQKHDATVVRSAAEITPGEELTIRFAEDHLTAWAGELDGVVRYERLGWSVVADSKSGPSGQARSGTQQAQPGSQQALSYEQARDELASVVKRLEAGGLTLEQSLELWERGEKLAAICGEWLDGARARLTAAMAARKDAEPEANSTAPF